MIYSKDNTTKVTSLVQNSNFINKCRLKPTYFTRDRKMGPKEIACYLINKKGLSSKMEILKFNDIVDVKNISAPAVLKQREKFNPEALIYLKEESLKLLYTKHQSEVKNYKGYLLTAIDGSDLEIPNTPEARRLYNGKSKTCARLTISLMYDLLNKYCLDCIIAPYDFSEITMAKKHIRNIKGIMGEYKTIRIMDRGYPSLESIYESLQNDNKFIVRLSSKDYKKERSLMQSDDEYIEIEYEYNRVKYYKEKNHKLYNYLKNGNTLRVRCINIELDNGTIETLLTNLEFEKYELKELYGLRWGIETNFHYLKESLKIEAISSSKPILIEQEIHASILGFNMMQSYINDEEAKINQKLYKNQMKINVNMAVGIIKDALILVLLEEDGETRSELLAKILARIRKYVVPVKPNRKVPRKGNVKNKHHINKRKTF